MPKWTITLVAGLGLCALVLAGVLGWDYWQRHKANVTRAAVIDVMVKAVEDAGADSSECQERLVLLTDPEADLPASAVEEQLFAVGNCGMTARSNAGNGYKLLESMAEPGDGPAKSAFLRAAGATFSVYEIQGDDFDALADKLNAARREDRPLSDVQDDVAEAIESASGEISAAQAQFERTREAYSTSRD